jgi:hypothetical protein
MGLSLSLNFFVGRDLLPAQFLASLLLVVLCTCAAPLSRSYAWPFLIANLL